ncbi:hypothetical protein [Dactylosporangium sp. NPDC051541]|uniref:hypothetical protein n=1 Tax=Dactylosporangium sp. NPDC051541 TaxID=3363977 RepID=UPI0037A830FD
MKHIAVVLAGALTLGALAGCEASVTTAPAKAKAMASPTPSKPPLPPKEALTEAGKALDTTAYNFALKQGDMTGGGRVDPKTHAAVLDMGGDVDLGTGSTTHMSLAYTVVKPDLWLKADFGDMLNKEYELQPGGWLHIDRTKITETAHPVDEDGDPEIGVTELLTGLVEVTRPDKTHFTGTIDVTDVGGIMAPSDGTLKNAGAKAKSLPFTAMVDEQGRLTTFAIDGAAVDPDLSTQLTFTGFGSVLPVTAPTSATEATPKVYELIG